VASWFAFAYGQDRMLPAVFAETSKRKVPLAGLILHAVLSTAFLVQAVYIGWAMGVAVRSIAVLLVWLTLALGVLNLKLHPRWRAAEWAAPILDQPFAMLTAIVSIIIAVPLIASIAIVPHTALIFQPLFQGAVVLAIGLVCLWLAGSSARARRQFWRDRDARADRMTGSPAIIETRSAPLSLSDRGGRRSTPFRTCS
jgi:basic amino acid/polyamine antiporter, APA family